MLLLPQINALADNITKKIKHASRRRKQQNKNEKKQREKKICQKIRIGFRDFENASMYYGCRNLSIAKNKHLKRW